MFPNVFNEALKYISEKSKKFENNISALEFYNGQCFDSLEEEKKKSLSVDRDTGPRMSNNIVITKIGELKGIFATIFATRTASATKMNQSNAANLGSSAHKLLLF